MLRTVAIVPLVALLLAGCSTTAQSVAGSDELAARLQTIDAAITAWQAAPDLPTARRSAEEVRNLVVGADGPYYGDADGDGTIEGAVDVGVLPGLEGEPGLASGIDGRCVERDILGGSCDDAPARWATLDTAITSWSSADNTFPTLPSHPQRIVGWATLGLDTDDLAAALEYAGHAHLHVDVATAALNACAS